MAEGWWLQGATAVAAGCEWNQPHQHISAINLQLPMEPSSFNIAERERMRGGAPWYFGCLFSTGPG